MSEKEELEEMSSEIASELSVWRSFIESAGWQRLKAIAQGQIIGRQKVAPLEELMDIFRQEYMKGEIGGIQTFIALPEVQVEQLQLKAKQIEKELQNVDQKYEQYGSAPSGSARNSRWGTSGADGSPLEPLDPGVNPFGDAS